MDTFRSEMSYSSEAMGTSRLGSSSASLSFSLSSSRVSSRSDLVNNFENRFRERRAKAHKKQEREKKRIENNQRAESAQDKRRVEREQARELRKKEMENWLPTPVALKQVENASRQRSRARMREIRDWYPVSLGVETAVLGAKHDEMRPVFGDQAPNCRAGTKQLTEEAETKDKERLEVSMKWRLAALKDKVSFLEDAAVPDVITAALERLGHTRAGQLRPLERSITTEPASTPFHPRPTSNSRQLAISRSVSALPNQRRPTHEEFVHAKTTKTTVQRCAASKERIEFVDFNRELERQAEVRDEIELQVFLTAHRRLARREVAATKLQAHWRGFLRRRVFLRWSHRRWEIRRDIVSVWLMSYRVGKMAKRALVRSCLFRWRREVALLARLREIELSLFADAEGQLPSANLPKLVVNLALADDEWADTDEEESDDARCDGLNGHSESNKALPTDAPAENSVLGGLVNAAFLSVQQAASLDSSGRARLRRARHAEARANVRRKIAQRVFLAWKRAHATRRRVALNAQLCLKRAARIFMSSTSTASSRGVWPREKLLTVFDMWARYAVFARCRRSGSPLPVFSQPSAHWDVWVYNFQERQVRKVKAAARASVALQRRFLMRIRSFARYQLQKRHQMSLAIRRDKETLSRRALREWRAAIADQAANKKRCRRVLDAFHVYAGLKKRLRPIKQQVMDRTLRFGKKRAWRAWGGVHLRAVCKRAWNVARIEHCPDWRRKALHTLLVWRWSPKTEQTIKSADEPPDSTAQSADEELNPDGQRLRMWRILSAWRHTRRKRALFRSIRFHCARLRRRRLLFAVLNAWKQHVWKFVDDGDDSDEVEDTATRHVAFLEDRLTLDPWDIYRELSPMLPMLFFGYYSDAARIFGGVTTDSNVGGHTKPDRNPQRVYSAVEIRQFHRIISGESILEVRNAVLRSKHLVNAVDPSTGDSALHVALRGEDNERRLEVLVLLLTEGASMLDRANRHGQTPRQIASDDPEVCRLFERGVYTFFEETASKQLYQEDTDTVDSVVLWRVVVLMLGELQREARIGADARNELWHSLLKEELWLRQGRIRFPARSRFLPAVLRCRAFLDGMRKRVCRSLNDALHLTSDHETSLSNENFGELDPYARFLLAPLLEYEGPETSMIHSFAGVLFSLDIPLQEILEEAFRLEDACSALEEELLTTWEQMQSAERRILAEIAAIDKSVASDKKSVLPLLRYFKDQAEMEYAMKKTILLNTTVQFSQQESQVPKEDRMVEPKRRLTIQSGSMCVFNPMDPLKEIEFFKSRAQRKSRKLEKKLRVLEEQLPILEAAFRDALVAENRNVRDITAVRAKLEQARLSTTVLLVKQKDLKRCLDHVERIAANVKKGQVLRDEAQLTANLDFGRNADLEKTSEVQNRLNAELVALSQIYDLVAVGTTTLDASSSETSEKVNLEQRANALLVSIPSLQKHAVSVLRELFVTNLLRTCCCWLAENMALCADNSESETSRPTSPCINQALDQVAVPASILDGTASGRGVEIVMMRNVRRRRTSLTNTRRVLETFQRDSATVEVVDRDVDRMKDTYAESASLLFRGERAAMVTQAKVSQRAKEHVDATQKFTNPLSGQPETPPLHTVDPMLAVPVALSTIEKANDGIEESVRSRKREELKHAMVLRQIERIATKVRRRSSSGDLDEDDDDPNDSDGDGDESIQSNTRVQTLPSIHGTPLPIGNFVFGSLGGTEVDERVWGKGEGCVSNNTAEFITEPGAIEAMWKRGARSSNDASKPLAEGAPLQTVVTALNPPVGELPVTNLPKRVLSANRRAPDPDPKTRRIRSRRSSVHGMAGFTSNFATDERASPTKDMSPIIRGQSERDVLSKSSACSDGEHADPSEGLGLDFESAVEVLNPIEDASYGRTDALTLDGFDAGISNAMSGDGSDSDEKARMRYDPDSKHASTSITPAETLQQGSLLKSGLGAVAEDNAYAELDAFLSNVRSQSLQSSIQGELGLISLDHHYNNEKHSRSSTEALQQQSDKNPLIVWETKLGDVELRSNDAIVVHKLEIPVGTSERHTIEYTPSFAINDLPVVPWLSQTTQELFDENTVADDSWDVDEGNDKEQLSLMGKSIKMVGRKHRSELARGTLNASTSTFSPPDEQRVTKSVVGVDTASNDMSSNVSIPAISINVASKGTTVRSIIPEPNATGSVLISSIGEQARYQANFKGESKCMFELDTKALREMQEVTTLLVVGANGMPEEGNERPNDPSIKRSVKGKGAKPPQHSTKLRRVSTEKEGSSRAKKLDRDACTSVADLQLQGSIISTKNQPTQEAAPRSVLTKKQKDVVWKRFSEVPMSDTIQNAYAELYPQTYTRTPSSTSTDQLHAAVDEPHLPTLSASLSAPAGLSISSSRKSLSYENELKLNKKFWRDVEGYRAIGSSAMILHNADTIHQRRQDKAQHIFAEFIAPAGSESDFGLILRRGEHQRLEWVDMYPDEVAAIRRRLKAAPIDLFDSLQQTAQLRISTALATAAEREDR